MRQTKKNESKSNKGIFRVLELISEVIGWLQIVASPLLIGIAIGLIIYYTRPTLNRLIIGIIISIIGLIVGIVWATKYWKGKGTMWLVSRTMATPYLDKTDEVAEEKQVLNAAKGS